MKKFLKSAGEFLKGYSGIIKSALWVFILQIVLSLFSMVMLNSQEDPKQWLKLLSLVMSASALLIIFAISKSSAYSDFQIYKNNFIRKNKGEQIPLSKSRAEYRPYNGIIIGVLANLVTIILVIIGLTSSTFVDQSNACGKIALFINLIYMVPILNFGGSNSLLFILCGVFLSSAFYAAGYYLEGLKLRVQFDQLQKRVSGKP